MRRLVGPSLFTVATLVMATGARAQSTIPVASKTADALEAPLPIAIDLASYKLGQSPPGLDARFAEPHAPLLAFRRLGPSTMEASSPDDRLTFKVSSKAGASMFLPGQHAVSGQIKSDVAWRDEVELSLSTDLGENSSLILSTGALNLRSPLLGGPGSSRGFGEPLSWFENKVLDFRLKLGFFDNRLSYSGGVAWSDYRRMRTTRFIDPNNPLAGETKQNAGTSYWHRLDASLPLGSLAGASAYLVLGQSSDNYRSMRRFFASPLYFEGRTFEAGGKIFGGNKSLDLTYRDVGDQYGDVRELAMKMKVGSVQLTHIVGASAHAFVLSGDDYVSQVHYRKSTLRIKPSVLLGYSNRDRWLPESLDFRWDRIDRSTNGTEVSRSKIGLSLGWSGSAWNTTLGVARVVRETRSLIDRRKPTNEILANLGHSRTLGPFEISAYGSLGIERSSEVSKISYGGGFSASTAVPALPKLSLSIDYNGLDRQDDYQFDMESRAFTFGASADLTPYLQKLHLPKQAYLKLKAYGDFFYDRLAPGSVDRQFGSGMLIMFGTPFN